MGRVEGVKPPCPVFPGARSEQETLRTLCVTRCPGHRPPPGRQGRHRATHSTLKPQVTLGERAEPVSPRAGLPAHPAAQGSPLTAGYSAAALGAGSSLPFLRKSCFVSRTLLRSFAGTFQGSEADGSQLAGPAFGAELFLTLPSRGAAGGSPVPHARAGAGNPTPRWAPSRPSLPSAHQTVAAR